MNSNQADRNRVSDSAATVSKVDEPRNDDFSLSNRGRRGFLRAAGGLAVAGLLAGCTSVGSGGNAGGDGGNGGNAGTDDGSGGTVDDWLADTGNYGSIKGMTGTNSITVEVGAEGNSGSNAFAPPAVEISPGTTVVWKWVSGYHNVVAEDGTFESGEPEQNATFEHTFETPGTALYYCEPHKSMGMKGAVVVAGGDGETAGNTSNQSESQ